jgi:DNA primase
MSDLKTIKKRILRENRIEQILEAMGCEYINERGNRVEAQLPAQFQSDNKRSLQIKLNENLTTSIRSRPDFKTPRGDDIFTAVSYILHNKRGAEEYRKDLPQAKKFVCDTLGWKEYLKGGKGRLAKKDHTAPLKAIIQGKKRRREIIPNPTLDESILNQFYVHNKPTPFAGWISEGISYDTQAMYGVGFCLESKRIIIPMRNRFGKLIGVKGRIIDTELDDRKYLYLYRFNNSQEIFNFHHAHPHILMTKRVYIYEAEKSCLKAHSNGIFNTVALGSSEVTDIQAEIIKQIGLDIEIVLCYDKGITIDDIKANAQQFKGRQVYAMFDTDDLLEDKDAPIDCGLDVWNQLVEEYIFEIEV